MIKRVRGSGCCPAPKCLYYIYKKYIKILEKKLFL